MPVQANFKKISLERIGQRIVAIIETRSVEQSKDKDGKPFAPYSTNDYAKPIGALTKRARQILEKEDKIRYFKRGGNLFILIIGGYAAEREALLSNSSADPQKVTLIRTGQMWQNFGVTKIDFNTGRITVGFVNAEMAERMRYNQLRGRDPMGLTEQELNDQFIKAEINKGIVLSGDV